MITLEQAIALKHGQVLHHVTRKNADGTALRVRVNGKVQLWKTRPEDFRITVKYGLYQYGVITHIDAQNWVLA